MEVYHHEKENNKLEIERLNDLVAKHKKAEVNNTDFMNDRYSIENRLRQLDAENKALLQDKQKLEVDFRVLEERHGDLKANYNKETHELKSVLAKHKEEIGNIEGKFDKMSMQIEKLSIENNQLRIQEDKLRQDLLACERMKDDNYEKYQEYKNKYNIMNTKLGDMESELRQIMIQKDQERFEKRRTEDIKKERMNSKQKILEDFQNKISNYKTQLKTRSLREDY